MLMFARVSHNIPPCFWTCHAEDLEDKDVKMGDSSGEGPPEGV